MGAPNLHDAQKRHGFGLFECRFMANDERPMYAQRASAAQQLRRRFMRSLGAK